MRSAQERLELLDTLAAARQSVTAGVGVACSTAKVVARKAGLIGAASAATAIAVRMLGGLLFPKKKTVGSVVGGWLFGAARSVLVAAALPVVKEYAVNRLAQAVAPAPKPAARAESEPFRVRESSSFLAALSPKRIIAHLLKM